jgi:7-carboxy-7-deazaguanine synthase
MEPIVQSTETEQNTRDKVRVAEIFYSLQGEGLYQGTPSIFLRVFGCNFKCQGFGMPRGELSNEYLRIDPEIMTTTWDESGKPQRHKAYENYNDLPLVHTGCDSYASWDPRFKHLSLWMTVDEVVEKICSLLPKGKFDDNTHLILTGGEPLLPGWQKFYPDLIEALEMENMVADDVLNVTIETNGTQVLNEYLEWWLRFHTKVMFSISSKLPSSGEPWDKAIKPESVKSYLFEDAQAYFKWVVSNPEDVEDVKKAIDAYKQGGVELPVYLMPAGGTTQGYEQNKKWVAELCKEQGWRYSPRLQVDLYKNAWGT